MWESRLPIVRDLVEKGADPNYVKQGTALTPLHWAALNDDGAVVEFLMTKKATMKFSNMLQTPIDVAGLCNNLDVRHKNIKLLGLDR